MDLSKNIPWVEKYRPNNITKIYEQNEIVMTLQDCLKKSSSLPHCLFYGPPGTGKTTTALAISYQLFGPLLMKERVLELNASDERGIKIVREKIKTFAKRRINKYKPDNYNFNCPDYKIIILDEADALTDESQFALRRIIEENSLTTRFFLICNYVARINKPIISRCTIYRFKSLSCKAVKNILLKICDSENIKITNSSIEKIIDYCDGDLRKAINTLQRLKFLTVNEIDDNILNDFSIKMSDDNFSNLLKKLKNTESYSDILYLIKFFMNNGFGGNVILREVSKKIIKTSELNEHQKCLIFLKLSKLDYLLNNGSNEEIIIINLLSYISLIIKTIS